MANDSTKVGSGDAVVAQGRSRRLQKLIALMFWALAVLCFWFCIERSGLSSSELLYRATVFFRSGAAGIVVFLLIFWFQPIVFFPSALMGVAAGQLYGPVYGTLYTILGAAGASAVAYVAGRFLRAGLVGQRGSAWAGKHVARLRQRTFESVLVLHLVYIPFDLINYTSGFLRLPWRPFMLGSVIGCVPSAASFVLLGASVEVSSTGQKWGLSPELIGCSALVLVVSLVLSRRLRRRLQGCHTAARYGTDPSSED